jgi:hypothetical protein
MGHQAMGVVFTLMSILLIATIPVFLYKVFRRRPVDDR